MIDLYSSIKTQNHNPKNDKVHYDKNVHFSIKIQSHKIGIVKKKIFKCF